MSEHESLSIEQEVLRANPGDILVIKAPHHLTPLQMESLQAASESTAKKAGCHLVVLESGLEASVIPDMARLTQSIEANTAAVRHQSEMCAQFLALLVQMVQAEQDEGGEDDDPRYYMDGTRIN